MPAPWLTGSPCALPLAQEVAFLGNGGVAERTPWDPGGKIDAPNPPAYFSKGSSLFFLRKPELPGLDQPPQWGGHRPTSETLRVSFQTTVIE